MDSRTLAQVFHEPINAPRKELKGGREKFTGTSTGIIARSTRTLD